MGAGLSPATPDSGGSSAAALALAGNHKAVLRLLQKSCPGVPVKALCKNGHGNRHRQSVDLSSNSDRGNGRRRRDRRSAAGNSPGTSNNREAQQRVTIAADAGSVGTAGGGRGGGRGAAARGVEEAGHRLLKAARIGDTVAMSEILARGEVGVEWVGKNNGWTACMEAAEHGSLEGVCYLVDMG